MHQRILPLALVAGLLLAAGCGSAIDADLNKTPEQLQADAAKMDVPTLEKKLQACKEEMEALEKEGKSMGGTPDAKEVTAVMEKAFKLAMVMSTYEQELQKRKAK